MADIFISYARENSESAKRLAAELEARGWSVFWDRRIPAGRRFSEFISEKLATAKCVITLWSEAAVASDWVQEEAEAAKQRNVLVPALIEQVDPPWGFRRIQAADLVQWRGENGHAGFSQLLRDIERYAPLRRGATSVQGSVEASTATPESEKTEASQRPSVPVAAKQEPAAPDKAPAGAASAATETRRLGGEKALPETFEKEPAHRQEPWPRGEVVCAAAAAESAASANSEEQRSPMPLLDGFTDSPELPRARRQKRATYLKLAIGGVALAAGLLVAFQLASWRSTRLAAKASFNQGVTALRDELYGEAAQLLAKSLDLDPNLPTARSYLAEAYLRQFIGPPKNGPMGETALQEWQIVLRQEPRNAVAIRSIALLFFNQNKYTESKQWYEKALEGNPRDKIALCSLGAIAWNETYPAIQSARTRSGMGSNERRPISSRRIRAEVRAKYLQSVGAGIENLTKALEVDKDYENAMAYQGMIHYVLADMAADTAEYRKYTDIADGWMTKAISAHNRDRGVAEKAEDFPTAVTPEPPPPPPPLPNQ
jgi:tetratricopeptide (TPR) repeat protein